MCLALVSGGWGYGRDSLLNKGKHFSFSLLLLWFFSRVSPGSWAPRENQDFQDSQEQRWDNVFNLSPRLLVALNPIAVELTARPSV